MNPRGLSDCLPDSTEGVTSFTCQLLPFRSTSIRPPPSSEYADPSVPSTESGETTRGWGSRLLSVDWPRVRTTSRTTDVRSEIKQYYEPKTKGGSPTKDPV